MNNAPLLLALLLLFSARADSAPCAVATLRPVHSILAFIMDGVDEPVLLIKEPVSPHDYALRPSERRLLDKADIIFWVDDTLETFMPSVANSLDPLITRVRLLQASQINKLDLRSLQVNRHAQETGRSFDTHIWLSLENASVIARTMTKALMEKDTDNHNTYQRNLRMFLAQVDSLREKNTRVLGDAQLNFVVFHDAYQYLEHSLGQKSRGIVSINHEISPGARHLSNMLTTLKEQNIKCVFYQKPVKQSLLNLLTRESSATAIELDPLGYDITPGPGLYFTMMEQLVKRVLSCK